MPEYRGMDLDFGFDDFGILFWRVKQISLRRGFFIFLELNKLKDLSYIKWKPVIFGYLKFCPFSHSEYSSELAWATYNDAI